MSEIVENGNVKEIEMGEAEKEAEKFAVKREEMRKSVEAKELIDAEISSEMREAYLNYAMSVIVARALPSAEDGLKPVHRRILWAMNDLGLYYNKQTKKSAAIVGDTMGKYHPHGDASIYDAMVRMAQSWSLRYPLVIGQGNFGCFTADTKVKLVDGRDLSFKELVEESRTGKRNFAFSIGENGVICVAEIKNPRRTKRSTEIMLVKLDNGEEIRCTLNHKFMLKNGNYKEAQYLKSGDSLMPCYSRLSTKRDSKTHDVVGYEMIFQPKNAQWDFSHVLSDDWNIKNGIYEKSAGRIRHHLDFNKLNNNPDNIRRMRWGEHWRTHYNMTSNRHKNDVQYIEALANGRKKFWDNEKNREIYSLRMSKRNRRNWKNKKYREEKRKQLSEINKKYLAENPEVIEEIRVRASITMKKLWGIPYYRKLFNEKIIASNRNRKTNLTGKRKFLNICDYLIDNGLEINEENYERIRREFFGGRCFTTWENGMKKYFSNSKNLVLCELSGNHKVVGIKFLKQYEDVYDLTIDGTHNFALASGIFVHNSMDGDSPAAYRYTEAKMEKIAEELLMDIDKKTVEMMPNYSNTAEEPIVMPGRIPNLFLNGASGIAVGMATNIPPHNLNNVCDAILIWLDNPNCEDKDLIAAIKAPDFPTGGSVSGEIKEVYTEGRGRLVVEGRAIVEEPKRSKDKTKIVITEIPYQVNKSVLVEQIANLVRDRKLPDVSDIRDESTKGGVRIVIELKKDSNPKFSLNRLYKWTQLRVSFNANMLALVNRVPKLLTLREYTKVYVGHRQVVVRKTKEFDLAKAEKRLHIVEGLLVAQSNIDAVVKLIRAARGKTEAATELKKKYSLSDKQVEAILEMRLHQITSLEFDKLKKEEKELNELIEKLRKILGDESLILKIIRKELEELKATYGDARKTKVVGSMKELDEHDLVDKRDVVVTITDRGYIKRLDVEQYREQKRGGRGVIGSELTEDDFVREVLTCSTHDYLLFFTDKGKVHWLKAHGVPASAKSTKGKAIVNLLELKDERVTSVLAVGASRDVKEQTPVVGRQSPVGGWSGYLMMATEKGVVKKIELSQFSSPRKGGIKAIKVAESGDSLIDVKRMRDPVGQGSNGVGGDEVLLVTAKGQAIRFKSGDVRSMGRASYGVGGIKLAKGDKVVSLEILSEQALGIRDKALGEVSILTISKKGYGKRTEVEDYRLTGRAGKGVINMKVTDKTGEIVKSESVMDGDNIILTTKKGIVIRTPVKNIRVMGRATQGVRVIRLKDGDRVSDLVRVPTGNEVS